MSNNGEMSHHLTTAQRLGYPADTRLLIINADDFGMCHDENEATIEGLTSGSFTSSTLLVTCPWFEEAAEFGRANPAADLGVHLTLTSEWARYKWGPVLGRKAVPSLTDAYGYLWPDVPKVYANDRLDEAEAELRAQVEKAILAGISPTHLDSHMGPLHFHPDYHRVYMRLARDFRLPIRLAPRDFMRGLGMNDILDELERLEILSPDHFVAAGPPSPEQTEAHWTAVIEGLAPGVTEIYCHPAFARSELRSCARDAEQREADFRFFTSDKARRLMHKTGVKLIGYRALREAMRAGAPGPALAGVGDIGTHTA